MQRKNYKSDFKAFVDIIDGRGNNLGFPNFDFEILFFTAPRSRTYRVASVGGVRTNCLDADGRLLVVFDGHGLFPGRLNAEIRTFAPDSLFPDGTRLEVCPVGGQIELIVEADDFPDTAEIEMALPTIKGDPFTYEDFTEEQIEGLMRPAMDAAAETERRTDAAVADVESAISELESHRRELASEEVRRQAAEVMRAEAESGRETAEERRGEEWDSLRGDVARVETELWQSEFVRRDSESVRVSVEESRAMSESARVSAETMRAEAERLRVEAEKGRVATEKARTEAEGQRATAETGRDTSERLRATAEDGRKGAESARVNAENARVASESARVAAETARATEFARLKGESESATGKANTAAANANTQADYAKSVGDGLTELLASKQDKLSVGEGLTLGDDAHLELSQRVLDTLSTVDDTYIGGYCAAAWNPDDLSPDAIETHGDKKILKEWAFWLIDATANEEETMTPVGRLNPTNLLRFTDGRFAPTVGITEEQRAECDVALFLDTEGENQYCESGEFDPEAFYNEHGMNTPLYNADGEPVRILRPWETTETKYTIGVSWLDTVYVIDGEIGKSGKQWRGIFKKPVIWDGIDTSKFKIVPTAYSPNGVTTRDGRLRCLFYDYKGESNCVSSAGQDGLCTAFIDTERTYPRVNANGINFMEMARKDNANPESPLPYAEGGYHTLDSHITALEILYGTKALHRGDFFGSGISADDSINNEATWLKYGGVRHRPVGSETWGYLKFDQSSVNLRHSETANPVSMNMLTTLEYPKEQCMESQMAFSFAMETGVAEGERFSFYDGEYWYIRVPGTDDDLMNVRLYKLMRCTLEPYNSSLEKYEAEMEIVLRMSLYAGMKLSGDIFLYSMGGLEMAGHCDYLQSVSTAGNRVDLYAQTDQGKWHYNKLQAVNEGSEFGFEKSYDYLGRVLNVNDGYARTRYPMTPYKTVLGGGLYTGECFYNWSRNAWQNTVGKVQRIGARFGGHAYSGACSPRNAYCPIGVGYAARYSGGSAQFELNVNAIKTMQ